MPTTTPPHVNDTLTLPEHFQPGHVMTAVDIDQLRSLLAKGKSNGYPGQAASPVRHRRFAAFAHALEKSAQRLATALALPATVLERRHWFLLIAFIISLPLIWNIGYFSHDELQWLAFADKPSLADVPWSAWFNFTFFQYRPLTFNLWLLLSYFIGYQPILMHLARVLLALSAVCLLRSAMLLFDVGPRRTAWACWIFLLTPYAIYTDAWIGTFADSLCLIFMLMALRYVLVQPRQSTTVVQAAVAALPIVGLTLLALMSKESAIVFPAAILVAACRRRDRVVAACFIASVCVVLIYLGLRLDTILFPRDVTAGYHWDFANIPERLAEYTVFPFQVGHFEVYAARSHLTNPGVLVCVMLLLAALASTGWRRFTAYWLGWMAALGPVLILSVSANHYAYLAAAWACAFLAWTWHRIARPARILLIVPILAVLVHGYGQIREIRHIGRVQHHLFADLTPLLARGSMPIRIQAQRNREDFILRRLLTDIPSYHRYPVSDRVSIIAFADKPDRPNYVMSGDGDLIPVR